MLVGDLIGSGPTFKTYRFLSARTGTLIAEFDFHGVCDAVQRGEQNYEVYEWAVYSSCTDCSRTGYATDCIEITVED